ncbi:putative signal transducing protein [Luteimonas cucumeris]|uniref:Putative signal transducing protein n=2 Tax=Luteimonas cucumeris TaxID=985012 RepID=A0A562LE38_9GAMM|nr:putative signal transducing protein [Luteimonas cucumeris]
MVPVYDAAHSTDAYLVKNLLEQEGLASYIRGEYLQGGLGDIPVNGMMQVCVDAADVRRARAIIDAWNSSSAAFADDDDDDVAGSADERAEARPAAAGMSNFGRVLAVGLLGAAVGGGLTWAGLRQSASVSMLDYDGDGRPEEHFFYSGNVLARYENDRNHDGRIDEVIWYDRNGSPSRGQSDNDFDGRMESTSRYLHGQWQSGESDDDGDGRVDYRSDAISGVLYSEQWLDDQGRVSKQIRYKHGIPVDGEIDSDHDGVLDTRRSYDRRGEITRSGTL